MTWSAYVFGKVVSTSPTLSRIAKVLTVESFKSLFELISKKKVCCGVLDDKFIAMFRHKKGTLYSKNGVAVAYLHEGFPVSAGVKTQCTIRHVSCEMLVSNGQCPVCERYSRTLPSTYSYFIKKTHPSLNRTPHRKSNTRYMLTPQRVKCQLAIKKSIINQRRKIKRLIAKIEDLTKQNGIEIDEEFNGDIQSAVAGFSRSIEDLDNSDFLKVFWNQQVFKCFLVIFNLTFISLYIGFFKQS